MNLKKLTLEQIFVLSFTFLFIMPLLIIRFFFILSSYDDNKQKTMNQLDYVSSCTADKIDSIIAVPIAFISSAVTVCEKSDISDRRIRSLLDAGPVQLPMVISDYLLDNQKRVVYSSTGAYKFVNTEDLKGIVLYGIGSGKNIKISEPFLSTISNTFVVRASMPFSGGYIATDIDMSYIRDTLKKVASDQNDLIRIVTDNNEVIASTNRSYLPEDISGNPLMKIRKSEGSIFNFHDGDKRYIGAVKKIPSTGWYVIYEAPLEKAFSLYYDIFKVAAGSIVLLTVFALTTLFFIRQKLIRPLKKLTRISEMIADDKYSGFDGKDRGAFRELHALYDSFEKMSRKIDLRERELRNSEEFLRSILDSTTSTAIITLSMDSDPVITDINQGARNIYGYSIREMLGMPASALLRGLKNDLDDMCLTSRTSGNVITRKTLMMKKDGTVFPALCSVCPLSDFQNRVTGYICSAVDITDLTNTQNELYAEKERLDVTLRSIGEGVIAADSDGRIIMVNGAAEDMLGQEQRFFLGHSVKNALKISDINTGARLSENISDFSSQHTHNISARLSRKDGKYLSVYITSSLIKRPDKTILGSVYVFMDITERMLMENELITRKKQLERINTNLEKRVTDETEKRRRNEQMLFEQAKFAAMGQMISAIAHQWRQPLNALSLYVQDIEDEYELGNLDTEYIRSYTEGAMRLINHMSYTIDDFRNFFHSGTKEENCDILHVLTETISLVVPQLRNENIHYTLSVDIDGKTTVFDDKLPERGNSFSGRTIKILKNEFKQVVLNIVQNAKYASEQARKAGHITTCMMGIEVIYLEDSVRINIFNNGDRIPDDVLMRIFDPYFTTKPEGEGTGIGLYMSKIMIEEHMNGSLTAANRDIGAVFSVILGKG